MMNQLDVSIIIVNYNTADLIGACLESLGPDAAASREVFVVDNASTDGSAERIREQYPWVHLSVNTQNRGFAAANNQVLPLCRGRYLYCLNPDAQLSRYGDLEACIRFMDSHPRVGLAGTKLFNSDGTLQESISNRYPSQKFAESDLDGLTGTIACVMGSSMFARTDLIRQIGGFDEDFLLYGEDQDLCLRVRKAGYEIGYIENAAVIHYGGQSERHSVPAEVWKKKTRAEYLFYQKHYSRKTITKIRRADLLKARFRLITFVLDRFFLGDILQTEGKRIKYRAICETIKELSRKESF